MTHEERVKAITESPEAKGREELAEYLATLDSVSVEQARELMNWAPVDLESPSFSMRKSMERVISQMGHLRATAARDAAKSQLREFRAEAMRHAPTPRADANPDDVEPRMSLAERARQTYGKH